MTVRPGPEVAAAAAGAGFGGDALVTIVAIGRRESGWDDAAQGDLALMNSTWGPSSGVWQIRTVNAEQHTGSDRDFYALIPGGIIGRPGSGSGDLNRQARAAFTISGGGVNFRPWSTAAGISAADMAAAREAVAGAGTAQVATLTSGTPGGGGIIGGVSDALGDAMDAALQAVLGIAEPVADWLAQMVVRALELVGGAIIFAVGVLMLFDVIGVNTRRSQGGTGIVSRGIHAGRRLVTDAAAAAVVA